MQANSLPNRTNAPRALVPAAEPNAPTVSAAAGPAAGTSPDALPSEPAAGRPPVSGGRSQHPVVKPQRSRRPRTAFVLAGGASLGALQVGMLRALYERRISADLLVGTSAGALNAALMASLPQTVQSAVASRVLLAAWSA